MTTIKPSVTDPKTVELTPSYKIPIALILVAIPIAFLKIWIGSIVALLGLFLMFQTATIRLQFTETALDIYRGDRLLRRFPYSEWQNWQIFWQPIPILFYFKEIKSIHFLPILFSPKQLTACLEEHITKQSQS
ncbi:MAG: DUF3119 family protein [Xenococcaceae cyanobacterium]